MYTAVSRQEHLFLRIRQELVPDQPGDGDGIFEAGEGAEFVFHLHNNQDQDNRAAGLPRQQRPNGCCLSHTPCHRRPAMGQLSPQIRLPITIGNDAQSPRDIPLVLTVKDDSGHRVKRTVMLPLRSSAYISGAVHDLEQGLAVAGATVTLVGPTSLSVVTQSDGSFSAGPVTDGTYALQAPGADKPWSSTETVSVPPGVEDVSLQVGKPVLRIEDNPLIISPDRSEIPGEYAMTIHSDGMAPLEWSLLAPSNIKSSSFASAVRWVEDSQRHHGDGRAWHFGGENGEMPTDISDYDYLKFSGIKIPSEAKILSFWAWVDLDANDLTAIYAQLPHQIPSCTRWILPPRVGKRCASTLATMPDKG